MVCVSRIARRPVPARPYRFLMAPTTTINVPERVDAAKVEYCFELAQIIFLAMEAHGFSVPDSPVISVGADRGNDGRLVVDYIVVTNHDWNGPDPDDPDAGDLDDTGVPWTVTIDANDPTGECFDAIRPAVQALADTGTLDLIAY